jgi:hypothetical protein
MCAWEAISRYTGTVVHGNESGAKAEKKEERYLQHNHLSHAAIVCSTSRLSDIQLLARRREKWRQSHHHRFHLHPTHSVYFADQQVQSNPVADIERYAITSRPRLRSPRLLHPFRGATGAPSASASPPLGSSPLSRLAYTPLHATTMKTGVPRTTYAPPHSPGIPPPPPFSKMLSMGETDELFMNNSVGMTPPPITPAYPAFSKGTPVSATLRGQGPGRSPCGVWHTSLAMRSRSRAVMDLLDHRPYRRRSRQCRQCRPCRNTNA